MVSDIAMQSGASIVFTLVIISVIVVIRFKRMKSGVKISRGRAVAYMASLSAISAIIVGSSFYSVGIPGLFIIPYIATVGASAYTGYRFSKNSLVFWRDRDGSLFVKGGLALFAAYIGAMITRLAIGLLIGGSSFAPFGETTTSHPVASATIYIASIAIDFLMMIGVGLFIGRNFWLYRHYSTIQKDESVPKT